MGPPPRTIAPSPHSMASGHLLAVAALLLLLSGGCARAGGTGAFLTALPPGATPLHFHRQAQCAGAADAAANAQCLAAAQA